MPLQQKWQHNRAARLLACSSRWRTRRTAGRNKVSSSWGSSSNNNKKHEVAGKQVAGGATRMKWQAAWEQGKLQQQIFVYELTTNIFAVHKLPQQDASSKPLLLLPPPPPFKNTQLCNNKQAEITSKTLGKRKLANIMKNIVKASGEWKTDISIIIFLNFFATHFGIFRKLEIEITWIHIAWLSKT